MPHYDESFIHDDNINQKRNKRSYHVYKHGLNPLNLLERTDVLQALEERSTSVIKRNIRNIKHKNNVKSKPDISPIRLNDAIKHKSPDIISDHCPKITVATEKYYDFRNNNALSPCKSFDNLTLKKTKKTDFFGRKIQTGASLQNLADEDKYHYSSASNGKNSVTKKSDVRNSYCLAEARWTPIQKHQSESTLAPGVGIYRQISTENVQPPRKESEVLVSEGSGHRGSLRGANKLARRARSFKDDLLERISNMRSPHQHHNHASHLASALRSHSPLSPKLRNIGAKTAAAEEGELTPVKELERLVKEVTFGLKHFSDVITKRKLEMLPDNGTIVFESIANIHKAIKPYCSRSPPLMNAVKRLCTALATLIRLCDEITAISRAEAGSEEPVATPLALQPEHVNSVVKSVTTAVEEVSRLAQQDMTRPALSPRPPLVSPRTSAQRNSLPDIPLTPKERCLLTGERGNESSGVRASHSTESILSAPDSPPPKPARPNRKIELAPPLPPKRKSNNDNSTLALSIDRLSLQSHSSGSLDSMLNVSNDEDSRIAHDSSNHEHVFISANNTDVIGVCSCVSGGGGGGVAVLDTSSTENSVVQNNHNRYVRQFDFSNESGFVSVGHSELSTEHSFTSAFSVHHYSSHTDSTFDSTDCMSEMKCSNQSFESCMNFFNANSVTAHHLSKTYKLASVTSEDGDTPPELPAKTRRNIRADLQQHFPNVEIRQTSACSLHGDVRPHTLADHHPPRPPPLPLKKKHIMAYMEMFGNCSHPGNNVAAAAPDMFRHSIHTYNLASGQHTNVGGLSVQRHQHVQRSIAQSFTVQHFGAAPLSGSEDSVSITSSGTSPVPPEPPALPPKMNKHKQAFVHSSNELLPPPSPRPSSHNSITSVDESVLNNTNSEDTYVSASSPGKFPLLEEELAMLGQTAPSPVPSQRSETSTEPIAMPVEPAPADSDDIILKTDISSWLLLKNNNKDSPEIKGGHPDALVVLATKATKDFAYQEAFLATYRTWVTPSDLFAQLTRRARHFKSRPHELRSTLSLLTRVVADLTMAELNETPLMQEIMNSIYWLVEVEELPIAKAMRQILVEKQKQLHSQNTNNRYEYESPCYGTVSLRRDTLLDFKATEIAEQMTLLDAALFARITTAEVLSWPRDQSEESSPNLTRFTAHFNNMSYWARSRILEQDEAREREKYASKFLKVMKALRKMNNFNSFLALVSALDSPPVRRLGWPRGIVDALREHCALIDSTCSFRAYRQALAETQPPCIPYIGLVLQDLTFVHIGNSDLLPDGSINFTKRWQQYHIMENMKRFQKEQYKYKRNDRIQAMFNEFEDVLSEEAMWQVSESIKPRGGRGRPPPATAPAAPLPAAAPLPTAAPVP